MCAHVFQNYWHCTNRGRTSLERQVSERASMCSIAALLKTGKCCIEQQSFFVQPNDVMTAIFLLRSTG